MLNKSSAGASAENVTRDGMCTATNVSQGVQQRGMITHMMTDHSILSEYLQGTHLAICQTFNSNQKYYECDLYKALF